MPADSTAATVAKMVCIITVSLFLIILQISHTVQAPGLKSVFDSFIDFGAM